MSEWIGHRLDDVYGARVGRVISEDAGWLAVRLGVRGREQAVVPGWEAAAGAGHVWVPVTRDQIRTAPQRLLPLDDEDERVLLAHYGLLRPRGGPEPPGRVARNLRKLQWADAHPHSNA